MQFRKLCYRTHVGCNGTRTGYEVHYVWGAAPLPSANNVWVLKLQPSTPGRPYTLGGLTRTHYFDRAKWTILTRWNTPYQTNNIVLYGIKHKPHSNGCRCMLRYSLKGAPLEFSAGIFSRGWSPWLRALLGSATRAKKWFQERKHYLSAEEKPIPRTRAWTKSTNGCKIKWCTGWLSIVP